MLYLLIALGALAVGPLLLHRSRRWPVMASGLDGFVATAITGLIFLQFVPLSLEEAQWGILAAVVVGFFVPIVVERTTRDVRGRADRWGLILGLTGLALHAGLDGAALATVDAAGTGASLAVAVILHRLPVGIAVWWLVSRARGRSGGVAALLGLMAATAVGFYLGTTATRLLAGQGLVDGYQAIVGGSLIHVVLHRGHALPEASRPRAEGWGSLAAVALLLVIVFTPGEVHPSAPFLGRLLVLSALSAPALLVAYLLAGVVAPLGSSAKAGQVATDGGSGPWAPPVAASVLALDAILLSIPLLGPELTVVRVVAAGGAALLVAWSIEGRLPPRPSSGTPSRRVAIGEGLAARLRSGLSTGMGEVVDRATPWVLVGLGVAALVTPWLARGDLSALSSPGGVLLFAALGLPFYARAAAATPLVAVLIAAGLSPGAGIAFLITGPAINLSKLRVLQGLSGGRAAAASAFAVMTLATLVGLSVDALLPGLRTPDLAVLTEASPTALQLWCLGGLLLLVAASVLRRGMGGFVGEVAGALGEGHSHAHHHDHDHDHGHGRDGGKAHAHDRSPPTHV